MQQMLLCEEETVNKSMNKTEIENLTLKSKREKYVLKSVNLKPKRILNQGCPTFDPGGHSVQTQVVKADSQSTLNFLFHYKFVFSLWK